MLFAGVAMGDMDDARIQLTRMEGKIDLVNERHDRMNIDIRELRTKTHENTNTLSVHSVKLGEHSDRLGTLETDKSFSRGERAGVVGTVKVLWAFGGFSIAGVIALVLRAMNV